MIVASWSGRTAARAIAELPARAPLARQPGVTALGDRLERDDRRAVGMRSSRPSGRRPRATAACGAPPGSSRAAAAWRRSRPWRRRRAGCSGPAPRRASDRSARWPPPAGEDRQIRHQPLGPALGDDRDAIAGANPERAQPERQVADALEDLLARERVDPVRPAATDQLWILRTCPRHVKRQVGDGLDVDLRGGSAHGRPRRCVVTRVIIGAGLEGSRDCRQDRSNHTLEGLCGPRALSPEPLSSSTPPACRPR